MAGVLALLIAFVIQLMMRGWRERGSPGRVDRHAAAVPDMVRPPTVADPRHLCRLHAGSDLERPGRGRGPGLPQQGGADSSPGGILVERSRAQPIWIPNESISGIRTEHAMAGKVAARDGILAIRWRLPSGVKIDTGFRADNRDEYKGWLQSCPKGRAVKAMLVLDDGWTFTGTAFGAVGETLGEAVFSTGMSGYQETLTDPSYHRQIVVATAPQIGNTGWNGEDGESRGDKIWVAGYAVRDPSPRVSNWRATGTLEDESRPPPARRNRRHRHPRGGAPPAQPRLDEGGGVLLGGHHGSTRRVGGTSARPTVRTPGADLAGQVSTVDAL